MTPADKTLAIIADTTDSLPDWSQQKEDLLCPLCEYNLRGLVEPRCPECGFVFRWAELIDGQRFKHPYLFEHQNKRNLWSFFETYSSDSNPRRFWKEVSPAQPVNAFRLMVFWLLSAGVTVIALAISSGLPLWFQWHKYGYFYGSGRTGPLNAPLKIVEGIFSPNVLLNIGTLLAWPWLTFATMYVFRVSMNRAKLNFSHILRAVIYACDFGLTLAVLDAFLLANRDLFSDDGWICAVVAIACAVLGTYRLTFAYSRYLRFHLPFFTVLASQLIVFLVAFMILLNCTKIF